MKDPNNNHWFICFLGKNFNYICIIPLLLLIISLTVLFMWYVASLGGLLPSPVDVIGDVVEWIR